MKIFSIVVSLIALGLIVFNAFYINLKVPFEGQSLVALITIMASLCVIVLVQILRISKRIEKAQKRNNP